MAATILSKLTELQLISGTDIIFEDSGLIIKQPKIKDIAMIGEETFFMGCEMLKISKDILQNEDKIDLSQLTDFDIFIAVMNDHTVDEVRKSADAAWLVLSLLFPNYEMTLVQDAIRFTQDDCMFFINKDNFKQLREYLNEMFCLKTLTKNADYNPQGELAKKIARKLAKGRQQAAASASSKRVSIFSRYISILAVGQQKDMNSLLNYTIFQLFDEFKRFELKEAYDQFVRARLAGAEKIKEPSHWMKDLYEEEPDDLLKLKNSYT